MNDFWNGTLAVIWSLCVLTALAAFGGVVNEYALPLYLCGALLALLWAVKLFRAREASWIRTPLHIPLLALLAYTAVRAATATIRHEAQWELLQVGLYVLVYFVTAFTFRRSRLRAALLAVLVAAAVLESVYGLWQYAMGVDKVFWFTRDVQYHGRGSGSYICPNHLAGLLEVVALMVLTQLLVNPRPLESLEHSVIIKMLESVSLVVVVGGLVATGSRAGWMATGVALAVFWVWSWRTRLFPPRVLDTALVLLVAGAIAMFFIPSVQERISQAVSINPHYTFDYDIVRVLDKNMEGRGDMTHASWQVFKDHPWFGSGPASWRWFQAQHQGEGFGIAPVYAHNDVLQFAAEYGVVGLALLAAAIGCFFWQALRTTSRDHPDSERALALGGALAVCALLAHSFVDFNMHIPANALLIASIVGLTTGISDDEGCFQRRHIKPTGRNLLAATLVLTAAAIGWNGFRLCSAQRHWVDGRNFAAMRQWTDSVYSYQQALALAPHFAEAQAGIGNTFYMEWNECTDTNRTASLARDALTAYQRALALNPRNPAVWVCSAQMHESLGDTNSAFAAFENAFTFDPHNAAYWFEFGRFLEHIGRDTEALRAYETAHRGGHPNADYRLQELRAKLRTAPR